MTKATAALCDDRGHFRQMRVERGSLASRVINIPDAWLMGATYGGRMTVRQAIQWWLDQERMEHEFAASSLTQKEG